MNQDETIALFLQGKGTWNAWAEAMLAERKAIEADGRWSAEDDVPRAWMDKASADFSALWLKTQALTDAKEAKGRGAKEQDADAPSVKSIVVEAERIEFQDWIFPGEAGFGGVQFHGSAGFDGAQFHGRAWFGGAQFHGEAGFSGAQFHDRAWFGEAQFHGWAGFGGTRFHGRVGFGGAQFQGWAKFDEAQFHGEAGFGKAQFHGWTGFGGTQFHGPAGFGGAQFHDEAGFGGAQFHGWAEFGRTQFHDEAGFGVAQFYGRAGFDDAQFHGEAVFEVAQFHSGAQFGGAQFHGKAGFGGAQFRGGAGFDGAQFHGEAVFQAAQFHDQTWFDGARFRAKAEFRWARFDALAEFGGAQLHGNVDFTGARFRQEAIFQLVVFKMSAKFVNIHFEGPANFNAIRGERAFDLADAVFDVVPDFIQAHFEEAPRLDNVRVEPRMLDGPPDNTGFLDRCKTYPGRWRRGAWRRCSGGRSGNNGLRDIPARWRALKRLAVQAHDQDREHDFFARELRSARFVTDWPIPWPPLASRGWLGCFSFWAGILYGLFSNYGRSVLLPFLWWLGGVAVAAMFYFGAHQQIMRPSEESMENQRMAVRPWGELPDRGSETSLLAGLLWSDRPNPCYMPQAEPGQIKPGEVGVIALSRQVREQTTAIREAVQLALRDGFLILYGDADTAHRTYGCLYGIELYSASTPVAIVPPSVGLFSGFHKLYSAVMIFLFGLALRNMLKMK